MKLPNLLFFQHLESIPVGEKNPLQGVSQGDTQRADRRNGRAARAPKSTENADSKRETDSSASRREKPPSPGSPQALADLGCQHVHGPNLPRRGSDTDGTDRAISQDRSIAVTFSLNSLTKPARENGAPPAPPAADANLAHRTFHSAHGEIHIHGNRRTKFSSN